MHHDHINYCYIVLNRIY